MDAIKLMTEGMLKADKPEVNIGDTVKVHVRIKEGEKERIQIFEGIVIAKKHGGVSETFTVRKTAYGVGVDLPYRIERCSAVCRIATACRIGCARSGSGS